MKTALVIAATIVLVVPLAIWSIGSMLPVTHVATGSRTVNAKMREVGHWIRNVQDQPAWRPDVKEVVILETMPTLRYREESGNGKIHFRFSEINPGTLFESVIDDASLPFGGRWLIRLENADPNTVVTVREEGEVRTPLFRFFSKYVFGHEKTLNKYLDDLSRHASQQRKVTVSESSPE